MSFEESAVAEATEVGTESQFAGTMTDSDLEGVLGGVGSSEPIDYLDTPAAVMASRPNEIHQGSIVSVSFETAKTGTKGFLINLQSKDTGASFRYNIYPPADFFNPELWSEGKFDSEKLSKESPGINPNTGRPKQSPYQRYGATINSKEASVLNNGTFSKFADVQLLRKIAQLEGRQIQTAPPTSGEDFGPLLNELLAGVNVVFTLVIEKSEEYGDKQKVGKILSPSVLVGARFDKDYPTPYVDPKTGNNRGFIRAWDHQ